MYRDSAESCPPNDPKTAPEIPQRKRPQDGPRVPRAGSGWRATQWPRQQRPRTYEACRKEGVSGGWWEVCGTGTHRMDASPAGEGEAEAEAEAEAAEAHGGCGRERERVEHGRERERVSVSTSVRVRVRVKVRG